MLQQPNAEDFVLATGETHPVREFVNKSFDAVGITLKYVLEFLTRAFILSIFLQSGGKAVDWTSKASM